MVCARRLAKRPSLFIVRKIEPIYREQDTLPSSYQLERDLDWPGGEMIGKSGVWGPVTASGGVLISAMALMGWWFVRMPRSPAPPNPPEIAMNPSSSQIKPPPLRPVAPPEVDAPAVTSFGPRVDVVRITPNGDVVVAGRTSPSATVTLLDRGETMVETRADPATGEFVLLPPRLGPGAHALSLRSMVSSNDVKEIVVQMFSIAPQNKASNDRTQTDAGPTFVQAEPQASASEFRARSSKTTIARGDTLWRISRERLGRGALYPVIYEANSTKIRDPNRIYPNQTLTIP